MSHATQESATIDLMNGLFGIPVEEIAASPQTVYTIAKYVDEEGTPAAFLCCDLATACRLGAALTHIPAGRTDEAIAAGEIPEALAENLAEVLNISVSLVTPGDGRRIMLHSVIHGTDADGFSEAKEAAERLTIESVAFKVDRYGECQIQVSH